ncbi:phospho-N-acetylmuramoyl-pentapeptide-transferase [Intestinimonas butyriciproducens]|nr:phospho-N-acetylmuramoyl-pentapeptide-transferase [Intestinimonas butyriciproducens]MBM6918768.1 phospho-N-acetylmuramoyl-pentapeptide-transferase [Intestinimonas butyriciproducens]
MKAAICAFVVAFALTAVLGTPVIRFLKKLKFGQKILEDGPTWHMNKQYTPTMGGIMFIAGLVGALCACLPAIWAAADLRPVLIFALSLIFGLIGMVDDYTKIKKKQNQGLTPLQKLLLQIAAAALFVTVLRSMGYITGHVYIPFVNVLWQVPWFVYLPCAIFVIVGAVNAVNLTDGIDGLAASVTAVVALFFSGVFLALGDSSAVFSAGLFGALLGFLLYNKNPARVFMGDTGSLFLGGAVCGMAFACDLPLILVPVGIIYIAETLSDIIQVTYFKMTHGKRIFKMAPLHHHFEMCGWSEKKIVFVFTAITLVMCIVSYLGIGPFLA